MSVCKHIGKDGLCLLHSEMFYKEPCHEGPCSEYEPLTNAVRIRAMTDEELADYLYSISFACPPVNCEGDGCELCWLDWLKQDAERSEE